MKYFKYDLNSYNLHIIKTAKFKTVSILVNFKKPVKKEEVTIRNFLSLMLLQSTGKFPTKRLLSIEAEELYDINLVAKQQRLGKYGILSFSLTMLNEEYTEEGMYEKTLAFLFDILFNPHIKEDAFDSKSFNIVKNYFASRIKSIKDDAKTYSLVKMLEEMDSESPFSYRGGYLEELEKIDEKKLYRYYQKVIKGDELDIFVLGDIDVSQTKRLFKDNILINTIKGNREKLEIIHQVYRKRIKKVMVHENIKQAKLSIGCKTINLTDYEKKYVMPLYTNILGGPFYSKLFGNIREKHSLAYYIASNYINADNLLLIYSGIEKDNFAKTVDLIKKEILEMARGNISDTEINNAKNNMLSVIDDIVDNPTRVINNYLLMELLGYDDLATRKRKIKKVTIEELKKTARKIKMDTVFLLYGDDKNEKDND